MPPRRKWSAIRVQVNTDLSPSAESMQRVGCADIFSRNLAPIVMLIALEVPTPLDASAFSSYI